MGIGIFLWEWEGTGVEMAFPLTSSSNPNQFEQWANNEQQLQEL